MNGKLIAGITGAAVVLLAAGIGITRADFGPDTSAQAETTSVNGCGEQGWVTLTAPATVPVNSSVQISALAAAPACAYPQDAVLTIAFGTTVQPGDGQVWIDSQSNAEGTALATLNGSAYAVGDTVQVTAALTSNPGTPAPIAQTQTVTVVAAATSDATVTVEVPSTAVYAGQQFALSGTATNINPQVYPNGVNLQVLLDGAVVGSSTLENQTSGSVTATVDGSTAGVHTVVVQLTTDVGAPAATAQKSFTILAGSPSAAPAASTQ
jgi:hypothetical protein